MHSHTDPEELPSQLEEVEVELPDESEWEEGHSPYDEDGGEGELDDETAQDPEVGNDEEAQPTQIRGLLSPQIRHGAEAVRWALNTTRWTPSGMCQQFTRSTFGVGAYYGSAIAAWNGAEFKHRTDNPYGIPRGVPVYFSGGTYGHAAVSLGNGLVRSTDWPSRYNVGTARIVDIERYWNRPLLGWTEDINTVKVWERRLPTVDAGNVAKAARREEKAPQGARLKRAVAKEVGKGNMHLNTSVLGAGFKTQYAEVQRKYLRSEGIKPTREAGVDGTPGINSLTWLGSRHGFNVRP